jgi:hypothetical protein
MERLQSYVSQLNEKKKASEKSRSQGSKSKAMFIIGIVLTCTGILAPIGLILCIGALVKANDGGEYAKQVEAYLNRTNKEEYYADLFAGMYNLPQAFAVGGLGSKLTPNQVDTERLNRLAKLERELGTLVMDPHPSATERSYAGMKIAKALLESKEKLDPSVKKYCEWIVENYSSLEQTNVKEIFSDQLFDPKEAENLDEHLQKIAKGGGVTVTESAKLVSKISRPRRW